MKKSRRNRKNNNQTKVQETKIVQTVNNEVPVTEEDIALKNAVISNIENSEVEEKEVAQPKSNTANSLLDALTQKVNSIVEETVASSKTEPAETKVPVVEPITVKCEYNRDNGKLKVYTTGEPFVLSLQALSDEYSPVGEALPEAAFRQMAINMERIFFNVIPKFLNPCAVIPSSQFVGFSMTTLNGAKPLATNEFRCFNSIKNFEKIKPDDRSNYVIYKFEPHAVDEFIAFASDANDGNLLLPLIGELVKLTGITTIDKMSPWMTRKPSDDDRELKESTAIIAVELDEAFKNSEYSLDISTGSIVRNGEEVDDFWEISSTVDIANIELFLSIEEFVDAFGLSLDNIDDGEDEDDDEDLEDYDDDEIDEDDEDDDSDDEFSIDDMIDEDDDDDYDDDDDEDEDDDCETLSEEDVEEVDPFQEYYEKTLALLSKLSRIMQRYYDSEKLEKVFSIDISTDSAMLMALLGELGLNIKADKNINLRTALSSYYDEKSEFMANLKMADYIVTYWLNNIGDFIDRSDEIDLNVVDDVMSMIANSVYTLLAYGLVDTKDMVTLNTLMSMISASEDGLIKLKKASDKVEIILGQRAKLSASISKASDPTVMTLLAQLGCYVSTPSDEIFDPPTNERFEFDDPKSVKRYCVAFGEYLQSMGCESESMFTVFIHYADVLKFGNEGIYGLAAIKFLAWLYDEPRLNKLVHRYF